MFWIPTWQLVAQNPSPSTLSGPPISLDLQRFTSSPSVWLARSSNCNGLSWSGGTRAFRSARFSIKRTWPHSSWKLGPKYILIWKAADIPGYAVQLYHLKWCQLGMVCLFVLIRFNKHIPKHHLWWQSLVHSTLIQCIAPGRATNNKWGWARNWQPRMSWKQTSPDFPCYETTWQKGDKQL